MANWLLEVVEVMNCNASTYFLSIHIMDFFLHKTKSRFNDSDVHLIGITSLYIASKIEDMYPLRMNHIVKDIGKSAHSCEEVKMKEKQIIKEIDFMLFPVMAYDVIMMLISDLEANNEEAIQEYGLTKELDALKGVTGYLVRVMLLKEGFSKYVETLKAVVCITFGFDLCRSMMKGLTGRKEAFLHEWVNNTVEECRFTREMIRKVYWELSEAFAEVEEVRLTGKKVYNVSLFYPFDFGEVIKY